jgi:hypothetical protein
MVRLQPLKTQPARTVPMLATLLATSTREQKMDSIAFVTMQSLSERSRKTMLIAMEPVLEMRRRLAVDIWP